MSSPRTQLSRGNARQVDNISSNTYSFSTPDEGFYSARVYAVSANGIAGVPSNVITYSVFYNNPLPAPPAPLTPANGSSVTMPLQLAWTDVANPQPSGYELQIAKDPGFTQIEEHSPQLNNANRTELSLTPGQKFWRVRSTQGDASPTTGAVTAWSATGSFTVNPAPPSPVSLSLPTTALYSGNTVFVQIQLSGAAPANGTVINLTSSSPAAFACSGNCQHARQHRMDAVPDADRTSDFNHASNSDRHAQLRISQLTGQRAAAIA